MTVDTIWQDIRHGASSLRRTPALTTAAVLTLALGIGANTAIFSLVQAVMLRQLPISAPGELYFVAHGVEGDTGTSANLPWLERVRQRSDVFDGVTVYNHREFKVSSDMGPEQVLGQYVSGNYHAVLGVPMALGRGLAVDDDRSPGSSAIAVISDSYWSSRFARSPDVLGRTLIVGGHHVSIVGVTAAGFTGLAPGDAIDITLPLSIRVQDEPDLVTATDSWISLPIVVRLKDGVTAVAATQALESAYRAYMAEPYNAEFAQRRDGRTPRAALLPAARGTADLRNAYATALQVLMGMVGLVLLIACANVANLLLVRAAGRAREIAIRMAVGATRPHILRQFLIESLLMALGAGGLGLILAGWGTTFVSIVLRSGATPIAIDAQPDGGVLLFTLLISLATGVVFGLAPAYAATRAAVAPALKGLPAASRGRTWVGQQGLVAAQIALCLVLVFGAGLLARTLGNLRSVDGGFRIGDLVVFAIDARDTLFPAEKMAAACAEVVARLKRRPGVVAAACSTMNPVDTSTEGRALTVPGFTQPVDGPDFAYTNSVDSDYFHTLGIGLLRGRAFTPQDTATSLSVAVISDTAARYYFGSTDVVGRVFRWGRRTLGPPVTIVGVVGDTRLTLRDEPPLMIYTPLTQRADAPADLLAAVRTSGSPAELAPAVRQELAAVSKDVALRYVRPMTEQIDAALVGERLLAMLSATFAGLALVLACVGLYGVMSYDVSRRTREIGIRLALGARRSTVVGGVLRQVAAIAGIGLVMGGLGASLVSNTVSAFLFGVEPGDRITLAGAAALLGVTALAAGYFPAHRASRVEPTVALHAD